MKHKTLRCCILAVGDFPEGGATSQRLYLLAKILQEGLGDASLWILHPTAKVALQENRSNAGEWGGVKFSYLSGRRVRPTTIVGVFLDTFKGINRSVRLIASSKAMRPDVLVLYTPSFLKFIIPMTVAKLLRVPIIVEICEIYSKSTDKAEVGFLRRIANSGELLMERLIPIMSAGILVISQGIRRHYQNLGVSSDAFCLLPVLVDRERYQIGRSEAIEYLKGVQFLLNSGSFNEKDGLIHLIQAVAKVRDEYPKIKLVFTGAATASTREKILKSTDSEGRDWIIFTGLLSRDELVWCYKNARGLMCCRSNSDYANYGFPTKLAEYLASGCPVVATTVGDVREYLADEETAFLATPENIESIALAIRRLLRDSERAEKVGHSGAKAALKYFDYRNHVKTVTKFVRQRIGAEDAK